MRVRVLAVAAAIGAVLSCSDPLRFDFPRPSEPEQAVLHDLVSGPVDEPSAFDLISGRGRGLPRLVRVDQSGEWDIAFSVMNGEPVWLPRGFFDGFDESGGLFRSDRAFQEITEAPEDRLLYEEDDPVPIETGAVYVMRSRPDRSSGLPCRMFAKLEVLSIETAPARARIRYLWNPNCDDRNLRPAEEGS